MTWTGGAPSTFRANSASSLADADGLIGVGEVPLLGFLHGPRLGPQTLVDQWVVGQQRLTLGPAEVQRFGVVDDGGLRLMLPNHRSEELVVVRTGDDDHVVVDMRLSEMILEVTFEDAHAHTAEFAPTPFAGCRREQRHEMIRRRR